MKTKIHGNGFIKVFLEDNSFIHIYNHDIPKQKVDTSIHDHRFSFTSTVLQGVLIHTIYNVIIHPQGGYYICFGSQNDKLIPLPVRAFLEENSRQIYKTGEKYSFGWGFVHKVDTFPGMVTVTHMIKTQVEEDYIPRIFVPIGSVPDNDFDNSIKEM